MSFWKTMLIIAICELTFHYKVDGAKLTPVGIHDVSKQSHERFVKNKNNNLRKLLLFLMRLTDLSFSQTKIPNFIKTFTNCFITSYIFRLSLSASLSTKHFLHRIIKRSTNNIQGQSKCTETNVTECKPLLFDQTQR